MTRIPYTDPAWDWFFNHNNMPPPTNYPDRNHQESCPLYRKLLKSENYDCTCKKGRI